MIFHYSPDAVLLVVSALISGILSWYVWKRRSEPGGFYFSMLLLASAFWACMIALEMMAADDSIKYLSHVLLYLGYLSVPPLWLMFTMEYSHWPRWLTFRYRIMIWVIPITAMALVVTNPWHMLVWPKVTSAEGVAGAGLEYQSGIVDKVVMGIELFISLIGTIILLVVALNNSRLRRGLVLTLITGALVPLLWGFVYVADLSPFPDLDLTPFAFAVTGIIFAWGIFRQHMFDIMPVAYQTLINNMTEGMLVLDDQGRIVGVNPAARRLLGVRGRLFGLPAETTLAIWPDLASRDGRRLEKSVEIRLDAEGDYRWIDAHVSPLDNNGGQANGQLIILRDVTERKRAAVALEQAYDELIRANKALEAEVAERRKAEGQLRDSLHDKEILLKEIHHRVKNNLQIISSLLSLQSAKSDGNNAPSFKESQDRIRSMALIHEKLYQSGDLAHIDFAGYVQSLTDHLSRTYMTGQNVHIAIDIKDISLGIDSAIPCGLIINELVSNSLKYAFKGRHDGTIRVSLFQEGGSYQLVVSDDGVGLSPDIDLEHNNTLGLHLVGALVKQIGGTVQMENHAGTTFTIRFR